MKCLISYLWQLPQHLLGLLLILYFKAEKRSYKDIAYYYSKGVMGGISLGKYIILSHDDVDSIKHEYGHSVQSRRLGWLYLTVIGLPSLLWAIFYRGNNYYSFYTEKWADKLGGVKR